MYLLHVHLLSNLNYPSFVLNASIKGDLISCNRRPTIQFITHVRITGLRWRFHKVVILVLVQNQSSLYPAHLINQHQFYHPFQNDWLQVGWGVCNRYHTQVRITGLRWRVCNRYHTQVRTTGLRWRVCNGYHTQVRTTSLRWHVCNGNTPK